jgi:hypothetical protein
VSRYLRELVLVVLAVTAGCNALGPDRTGTAAPELTPAPVPTDAATTAAPTPGVAPGVETTGIGSLSTLVDAHVAAARNSSWVWTERERITQTTGNVTLNTSSNQTIRFAGPRTYHRKASLMSIRVANELRFLQDYEEYADGSVGYETWHSPELDRTVYRRDANPTTGRAFPGYAVDPLTDYLTLESATVSRVDVGQRPHYLVVGIQSTVPDYGPVSSYRARAVVREDGFVRRLNVTFTVRQENLAVEGRYNFSYRRVGETSVERPAWVDAAENATG